MVNGNEAEKQESTAESFLSVEDQRTYQLTRDLIDTYIQKKQDVPPHLLETINILNDKVALATKVQAREVTGQNLTGGQGQEQGPS